MKHLRLIDGLWDVLVAAGEGGLIRLARSITLHSYGPRGSNMLVGS